MIWFWLAGAVLGLFGLLALINWRFRYLESRGRLPKETEEQ